MEVSNDISSLLEVVEKGLVSAKGPEIKFKKFVEEAWHVTDPTTKFSSNWHIDIICDHLEAAYNRDIKRLVICIPPRFGKSRLCSVFFPAWAWTKDPSEKFLFSSYSSTLSTDHSVSCRNVILSNWYQRNWGHTFKLSGDLNLKTYFVNDRTGYRIATSVGGAGTGLGGTMIVCDDPHNVKEAPSKAKRQAVIRWWTTSMSTRLNDPKTGVMILVQQRVHEEDLAGYLMKQGGWEVLELPMEYEPRRSKTTSIGFKDPRTFAGELLWPSMYDKKDVEHIKKVVGTYAWASQYQQNPVPPEGGIVKKEWWRYFDWNELPKDSSGNLKFDVVIHSWDFSFKSTSASSYVVGQVWAAKDANRYLLHQIRKRLDFPESVRALEMMYAKWPCNYILVEEKANGPAVISYLKSRIPCIIPFDPGHDDKVSRLNAIVPFIEAGNVLLPRNAAWVDDYIEEFANATPEGGGAYWDQIDSTTQALLRLQRGTRKLCWGRDRKSNKKSILPRISFGRNIVSISGRSEDEER